MVALAVLCFALWFLIGNYPDYAPLKTALLIVAIILVVLIVLIYVIARFFWLFALFILLSVILLNWGFQNYHVNIIKIAQERGHKTESPFLEKR
jgi:hypothetical protein